MDLIFNRKEYIPPDEFFGDFPKEKFGISSKFEIGIIFKNSDILDSIIHDFIFDTGAYISYAPDIILKRMSIDPRFEGVVYGIVSKKERKVTTKVAEVKFILIDDNGQESKEIKAWFAFHPFKNGPYLLGMKDVIENLGIIKKIDKNQLILTLD